MTSKLKPNDIAIGITSSRKGRTASKTRLDALEEIPSDTNSHACVCRNNSKGNCSVDSTSSRRCRSMGPRPASKGFVSPRGISVGASSSDESSHRYHRQQPKNKSPAGGRGAKAGPAAKGKNSRPTSAPSKPKGKSPVGKPSPILKLKPKGAATPQSTPSGGSVADSKGKGKKSKSASASASASAKGLNVQGIVPLTPAEICARCNKYRIDQEQSECVPLDFSHVQQLESLAQSVNEESTRTLLYTVASIIEEKVCRQMFRCLLPCTCPGCKNRPNICQSLDKFLGGNSSSKGKRKAGAGEKSGGGKGGKKKSKASPNEDQKKKESGSPKKKKGKAEKSAGDGEKATGGKGGNDECVSPEGCTMPCKPTCYYDRDCCGSGGGWSNSSMRLGWWPGNRVRFPCYDRCWSNRSYDGTSRLSGLTDNLLPKDEMNRTNDDVGSNGNAACYQRRIEATNTSHSNIGFTDKLNGRWASSSYASHSIRPVSDIFRRYSADPSNPCPHDGIQPRENKDLASLSLYSDPSKIRDHIMGDLPEKPRSTWGPKLIYGDEDSARLLETFERNFTLDLEKNKANETSQEADSKVASPSNKESVSGTVHKRRFSPKKRTKKKPATSRSSSPTTRAVGEIEERTKALLCDAKLEICQENGVSISKSGQSSQECADNTSLIREFSPIQPPDVNTAYFTSQISQPINNEFGTPHVSRSASVEKQWWEGLPEKTSRTFNSVMLKKYSSSSAMPVSVEAIGTSQRAGFSAAGGTNPGTIPGLHGRSRSEPRLTQTGGTGTSDATSGRKPWNNTRPGQSADGRPDSARKTGSFTVCKGRPGKQTPKGKPTKKLWKY
ncbi:hypothetical protein EGW08_000028 [Elysia chlorotica]|uniref:Uncharacterized protein n=1 Tax=Elysia chlorotica TaxID=188477 RepID=A0A433UED0_ELYCH|nr:hypothetical protein EGW08_000028 [Elysia chlorotica]